MSPFFRQIKANDLIKIITKLGFVFDRQSGSHAIYYREKDRRRVVIPIHRGKDIKSKTLYGIIKDIGIEPKAFKDLL